MLLDTSGKLLHGQQGTQPGVCDNLEDWDGVGQEQRFRREGMYVCL